MTPCFSNSNKINSARVLLTHLREGDYAHAGDKEAIHMVVRRVLKLAPDIQNGPCLDVGSGFGGTADYLYRLKFHSIYGIDIDEAAVEYAKKRYQEVQFFAANADQISDVFEPHFFSFIYFFNVLYAIQDKKMILEQCFQVAKPGAILALFDYTTKQPAFHLEDLAGKPMYPIVLNQLAKDLEAIGWEIVDITDLSAHFLIWYQTLLTKMEQEQSALSDRFSQGDILKVKTTFSMIFEWLQTSLLGGAVVYARKPLH
jgi:ubiquinone/menaquinone biosynthesis C-methylase UbiE